MCHIGGREMSHNRSDHMKMSENFNVEKKASGPFLPLPKNILYDVTRH